LNFLLTLNFGFSLCHRWKRSDAGDGASGAAL
jgi:hypothetical protein